MTVIPSSLQSTFQPVKASYQGRELPAQSWLWSVLFSITKGDRVVSSATESNGLGLVCNSSGNRLSYFGDLRNLLGKQFTGSSSFLDFTQ